MRRRASRAGSRRGSRSGRLMMGNVRGGEVWGKRNRDARLTFDGLRREEIIRHALDSGHTQILDSTNQVLHHNLALQVEVAGLKLDALVSDIPPISTSSTGEKAALNPEARREKGNKSTSEDPPFLCAAMYVSNSRFTFGVELTRAQKSQLKTEKYGLISWLVGSA
jgi:hypothetical protein